MNVSEAEELLGKMEEQIRNQMNEISSLCKDNEPECEVHSSSSSINSSHKQSELQEHLDEICSLRDLFVMQSQALSMLQSETCDDAIIMNTPEKQQQECSPIPLVVASIPDPDEYSASSVLLENPGEATKHSKSFDEAVQEVTKSLDEGIFKALQDLSPTCVSKVQRKTLYSDGTAKTEDFDDDDHDSDIDSRFPDLESSDSEILAAINEIRKEASQMDAVMALDQLKTLQSELEVTTKALQERSTEVEDLRIQMEEMEERVACLELERDLFKADASKLKEDLKTCVERMFDISAVAGDSSVGEGADKNGDRQEAKEPSPGPQMLVQTAENIVSIAAPPPKVIGNFYPIPSSKAVADVPLFCLSPKEAREVIRRAPTLSDPTSDRMMVLDIPRADTTTPMTANSQQKDSIFRRTESLHQTRSVSSQTTLFDNASTRMDSHRPNYRRSSSLSVVDRRDANDSSQNRRCSLFRRSSSRRRNASDKNDIEIMRKQISQLHKMMKTSLSTSEKLRKRLAMISRYYEGIIRKLQEQVVETKTEKKSMEVQLASQISAIDHEKRVMIMQLELNLQRKEDEIERLRGEI